MSRGPLFLVERVTPVGAPAFLSLRKAWQSSSWRPDVVAVGMLLAVPFLVHYQLVFLGRILADYDVFVYFYPLRAYAAEVIRQGRLPLWDPYLFLGSPFLANPQTSVFYPLSVLFYVLDTPTAYNWSVVLHLGLAGAFSYAMVRISMGLGPWAGMVAGLLFMLSGFMSAQLGHINQLSASVWLPLILLAYERAVARRSPRWASVAGAILAVQLLAGHSQESYMSMVVMAVFGGVLAITRGAPWRAGAYLVASLVTGMGLAAIQMLPTLELSRHSIRGGGLQYGEAISFSLPPSQLLWSLLPGYWTIPFGEFVGYVGVLGLVLGAVALATARLRDLLFPLLLVAGGLFLALGGFNPVYYYLFQLVPGLGLFRVPARWLFVYTLGAALLAALGTEVLARGRVAMGRGGWWRALVLLGMLVLAGRLVEGVATPRADAGHIAAWAGVLGAGGLLALLASRRPTRPLVMPALACLVAAELWFAGSELQFRSPVPPDVYVQPRDSTMYLQSRGGTGRMLSVATEEYEIKEAPDYKQWYGYLGSSALFHYMVAAKLNEILTPNIPLLYRIPTADGYDGGVLPLKRYVRLAEVLIQPEEVRADGMLRSRLTEVPSLAKLDLLGVDWVVASKITDATIDGVYYDRAISLHLAPGERRTISSVPEDFTASELGVLSFLKGAAQTAPGTPAILVRVEYADGTTADVLLRAGEDTADESLDVPPGPRLHPVQPWSKGAEFLARAAIARGQPRQVEVVNLLREGTAVVKAISLIDGPASLPLVLDDALSRRTFFDVKVYERRTPVGRAYLVHKAAIVDDDEALETMKQPDFRSRELVLLAPGSGARDLDGSANGEPEDRVEVVTSEPERTAVRVRAGSDGYLVFLDGHYPGWQGLVDGVAAPVVRANLYFKAVYVPAGEHQVEFVYTPVSLYMGAAVSTLFLALLVLSLLVPWERTRGWLGFLGRLI